MKGLIGKKVKVKDQIGSIVDFYESPLGLIIIIVEFKDGSKVKAYYSEVEEITDEPEDPENKDEITISRDNFRDVALDIVAEESKKIGNVLIGMAMTIIIAKIERKLFGEADND